jgi:hypothetical protein
VRGLIERSLAIYVKHEGPDGVNTSISNMNLGHFHCGLAGTCLSADERKEHLRLSKFYFTEAIVRSVRAILTHRMYSVSVRVISQTSPI